MDYSSKFPIVEYYKRVVAPIDRKKYWVKGDKMMVCPLHDDVNPSLGVIRGKDGKETYHCFGCNSWGSVVDLHRRVSKRLYGKYLSEDAALRDLCKIFGVNYSDVIESEKNPEDNFDQDMRRDSAMQKAMEDFDISDFRSMILQGKREHKGAAYYNTLVMIMVDKLKSSE